MTPDIDPVAVERAVKGDRTIRLTRDEVAEVYRILTRRGLSTGEIAELLGVTARSVSRWRAGTTPRSRRAA